MRSSRLLVALLAATVAACASKSTPDEGLPPAAVYDVSQQQMVDAVLATFNDLGVTIDSGSPSQGLVRTAQKRFSTSTNATELMDCGGDPALGASTEQPGFVADYVLNVQFQETSSGGRSVLVRASFTGRTGTNQMQCASKGVFEREVMKKIDSHLSS